MKRKSLVSLLLVIVMIVTAALSFTACSDGADGNTPQLRINAENYWEVSYDNGSTWTSLQVKATGADGKDGVDGKDGINGTNGVDGTNGINGTNGTDGKNGTNGTNGKDGKDGKDGVDGITPKLQINAETNIWEVSYDNGTTWTSLEISATGAAGENGTNGTNGLTPTIGTDGYWYIGTENTGVYAGKSETFTVTFVIPSGNYTTTVASGDKVYYYNPGNEFVSLLNWYSDEACTKPFNFNTAITADTTIYSKWTYNKDTLMANVGKLTEDVNFGKASCMGTTACFGSVYVRVLADDHKYYDGAASIANYLKGVFVETGGKVTVSASSSLRRISYTDPMTVINFASALSSYQEYILRNEMTMPEDIAAQKALAIKFFETVDDTAEGYHTHSGSGMTFPSMAVAVVALGNLMEQQDTARYDTLIKAAYENADAAFWNSAVYLNPFYQLCAKYDWYTGTGMPDLSEKTSLATSDVLSCYGFGIDLEGEYTELWDAFVVSALLDGKLNASEAKAFAYHFAYQLTDGDVYLGVYGNSRDIVDYSKLG